MAEPGNRRLFAGIALDDAVRSRCAGVAGALRRTGFDAKYEPAEKYHVTLAFLGNVAPQRLDEVAAALRTVARASVPFELAFDRLGGFPHERRPRVVVLTARSQGSAYRELAVRAHGAYAALGFSFKEDPVAHVTIARVKAPKRPLPLLDFAPIVARIGALTLFESIPDPARNTSRYEAIVGELLAVDG